MMMWRGASIRGRWRWFRRGVDERFPLCCVARFALSDHRTGCPSPADRGICYLTRCGSFVVCGVLHRNDPDIVHDGSDNRMKSGDLLIEDLEAAESALHRGLTWSQYLYEIDAREVESASL